MKLLSVIIPTYNMEKYLTTCLDSLLVDKECSKFLEVLIINDGSKDSSSQIAHTYADKYPDVFIVIDKENGNYGSCINRGLKEATGKYIKILDADDHFYAEGLDLLLKRLETLESDLVITDFHIINEAGKITQKCKFNLPKDNEHLFEQYCNTSDFYNMQMHAVAYNRKVFNDLNYHQTEGISYTDQEWMFYPMVAVKTFTYTSVPVYRYLLGRMGQTMSDKNVERRLTQALKIIFRAINYLNDIEVDNKVYKYLNKRMAFMLATSYKDLLSIKKRNRILEIEKEVLNINPTFYDSLKNEPLYSGIIPYKFINGMRNGNIAFFNFMVWFYRLVLEVKSLLSR